MSVVQAQSRPATPVIDSIASKPPSAQTILALDLGTTTGW